MSGAECDDDASVNDTSNGNTNVLTSEHVQDAYLITITEGEYGTGPIITTCVLVARRDGSCELKNAKGRLTNDINAMFIQYARSLGFHKLKFRVRRGLRVSRYAKGCKTHSDRLFDYYKVDL